MSTIVVDNAAAAYDTSMLTFVRNRGELAEGWYDAATLQKAVESATKPQYSTTTKRRRRPSPVYNEGLSNGGDPESSDDDAVGPALPNQVVKSSSNIGRHGPSIPNMQDLELQRGIL